MTELTDELEGSSTDVAALLAYVPQLVRAWPDPVRTPSHAVQTGSMVFVDISGFTAMSERLARRGRVGAEEVTEVIGSCFATLLAVAYGEGGGLLKFGGDALLLFFPGDDHELRAVRAAARMRRTLREIGAIETSAGKVRLRMSVGVHSGEFAFYLVGEEHRELVITGPAASETVTMEATAAAGEVVLSAVTADAVPSGNRGATKGSGFLLRGIPTGTSSTVSFRAEPAAVAEAERYLPREVRRYLTEGGSTAIHRVVTTAFVHFGGTDDLAREQGHGAVSAALHDLVSRSQRAAAAQRIAFIGTDVDRDGGKIILVAGAPSTDADDAGRMLHALRTVVSEPSPLHVQVGVNRGHVFAGAIGPAYRRTYTVMGDAVNLAARVMSRAGDGQILATATVLDSAEARFATSPLEPFHVKGKSEPVVAFEVGEPVDASPDLGSLLTGFVGRIPELAALDTALDRARAGNGEVVEITGPAGIGKSALLTAFLARADADAYRTACHPYETSTPYRPVRRLLTRALSAGGTDLAATLAAAQRLLADRRPDLLRWLPLVADVLGIEVAPTPEIEQLEDRFRPERTAAAVHGLVSELWREPTIVVIEDVQWIDRASSTLLASLSRGLQARPWLVCLTRRDPGEQVDAEGSGRRLDLGPLRADDSLAIVRRLTADDPPLPHLVDAVIDRAAGNPLFLGELVASLGVAHEGELPASLESALEASIDRLPPRQRQRLRELAVFGTTAPTPVVEAVLGEAGTFLSDLATFVEQDDPGSMRFRSALVRDTAYGELAFRRRRELHGRIADTVTADAGDEPDAATSALLSLHYFEAERYDEAWRHAARAAAHARTLFANADAARLYERCLAAARRGHAPTDAQTEAWEGLAEVRLALGDLEPASAAFRKARRLQKGHPTEEARLLRREAVVPYRAGRLPVALGYVTRALHLIEDLDDIDAVAEQARLAARYASIRLQQGHAADVVRWCERALETGRKSGARDALAHALFLLDRAYIDLGKAELAQGSAVALELYEEMGDLKGQATVLNNLGVVAYFRGAWADAVAFYDAGREAMERTGDQLNATFGHLNIAEIQSDRGLYDDAAAHLEQALLVCRATDFGIGLGFALMTRGRLRARVGRFDAAVTDLDEAADALHHAGARSETLLAKVYIAENSLLRGDVADAMHQAGGLLRDAATVDAGGAHVPLIHRVLGTAQAQLDRLDEAAEAFQAGLEVARERGLVYEVALLQRARSRLFASVGLETEAVAARTEAAAILHRLGVEHAVAHNDDVRPVGADVVGASATG